MSFTIRYETDSAKVIKRGKMWAFIDSLKQAYEDVTGKPFPEGTESA